MHSRQIEPYQGEHSFFVTGSSLSTTNMTQVIAGIHMDDFRSDELS